MENREKSLFSVCVVNLAGDYRRALFHKRDFSEVVPLRDFILKSRKGGVSEWVIPNKKH
jgi:hypothetical protein